MNVELVQELLDELGSSLESLETQQGALMQFLKDNGTLTEEQFAPYLEEAGKISSVRWRAARIRLESLISAERDEEERRAEEEKRQAGAGKAPGQNQDREGKTDAGIESVGGTPQGDEAKANQEVEGASESPENGDQRAKSTSESTDPKAATTRE